MRSRIRSTVATADSGILRGFPETREEIADETVALTS
jgi:hypothetical protein